MKILIVFLAMAAAAAAADHNDTTIRLFKVRVPEEQIVELKRRLAATQFHESETVSDPSQGVQLATMNALVQLFSQEVRAAFRALR
jgi:hypothetical protein